MKYNFCRTFSTILSLTLLFSMGCQQAKDLDKPQAVATKAAVSAEDSLKKLKDDVSSYSKFSSENAWKYLQMQVNMGPRYVGSLGHGEVEKFIKDELGRLKYQVIEQKFIAQTPQGAKNMNNILACANFSPEKNSIIVGAHYDTKLFKEFSFVGANDGASGVAVLWNWLK
ncbi:M28 family peptidase, partial [bacterium]|nr:M28 family peptidase [bacterium]